MPLPRNKGFTRGAISYASPTKPSERITIAISFNQVVGLRHTTVSRGTKPFFHYIFFKGRKVDRNKTIGLNRINKAQPRLDRTRCRPGTCACKMNLTHFAALVIVSRYATFGLPTSVSHSYSRRRRSLYLLYNRAHGKDGVSHTKGHGEYMYSCYGVAVILNALRQACARWNCTGRQGKGSCSMVEAEHATCNPARLANLARILIDRAGSNPSTLRHWRIHA